MLSDDAIEKLIKILVDRQEDINTYVLEMIAKRIKEVGELKSSDLYKLERLLRTGSDVRKINEELARLTGLQVKDIKRIIKEVAIDSYIDAQPYYDYRHIPFIPLDKNVELKRLVDAISDQTAETYRNLSNSTGFMIRDLRNPKKLMATTLSTTYQTVIDEAVQASASGIIDYQTAMRRTLKQLADSGLRTISYNTESGRIYTQRMDTAVRRNILDGIRQVQQKMQDEVGRQIGADGKELSVHMNPAEDHEDAQGHQFTNEEYAKLNNAENATDINGKVLNIGHRCIGQYNCRHFAYSIIIGLKRPNFSEEQLQAILDKNHKGYTTSDGKHFTMYECTQFQRQLETKVRYAKDGQIAAREAGDIDLARQYQAKINKYTRQYEAFSKACHLPMRKDKMTVSGYRKIGVK